MARISRDIYRLAAGDLERDFGVSEWELEELLASVDGFALEAIEAYVDSRNADAAYTYMDAIQHRATWAEESGNITQGTSWFVQEHAQTILEYVKYWFDENLFY